MKKRKFFCVFGLVFFTVGLIFLSRFLVNNYAVAQYDDHFYFPFDSPLRIFDNVPLPYKGYVDIPSSYTGSKVKIEASSDCIMVDLCGDTNKCEVSVSPGQRLYFILNYDMSDDMCAFYAQGSIYFYFDIMAIEDTGTPSTPSAYCGDGTCDSDENSTSCPEDCQTTTPSGLKDYGASCFYGTECKSSQCDNGLCCEWDHWCCQDDLECPMGMYCYLTTYSCKESSPCVSDADCFGYCVNGICQGQRAPSPAPTPAPTPSPTPPASYCGDQDCDSDETCSNCPGDCGKCDGESCRTKADCESPYCWEGECSSLSYYCGDDQCEGGEGCDDCPEDCGKCDGEDCRNDGECEGGHCVHEICRDKEKYCGDGFCDGDTCENCPNDCCGSDLSLISLNQNIYLQPEEEYSLTIDIENAGVGRAEDAVLSVLVSRPSVVNVDQEEISLGTILGKDNISTKLRLTGKGTGSAQIVLHLHGDNFPSHAKRVMINVEQIVDMDVPQSVFLLPNEEESIGILIGNKGDQIAKVQEITLESTNSSVVEVKEGRVMEVKGQGEGLGPDDLFGTHSEDLLRGIYPTPIVLGKEAGEAQLLARLSYHYNYQGQLKTENVEKKIQVKVGEGRGGKLVAHKFEIIPAAALLEQGEAREIEVVFKNIGSETIRSAQIRISESEDAPFEATDEIHIGYVEPGQEAKATFDLIATDDLGYFLEQFAAQGELSIGGLLTFHGEYATPDGQQFSFKDEMKVTLVEERDVCNPGDHECIEATRCLIELSNAMGCVLEFADIFAYLDKPVAVVLAASDICEIAGRKAGGDDIGAALNQIFFAIDVGDNLADAVPGAGNLLSGFIDVVEGAAQCAEGFVYDGVDKYCAAERHTGYRGCAKRIFEMFAQESNQFRDHPGAPRRYVMAVVASPVYVKIVDNSGNELTADDGVVMFQKEGLKLMVIRDPESLKNGYNFEILGQDDGEYSISIAVIDAGQVQATKDLEGEPIQKDETKTIPFLALQSGGSDYLDEILLGSDELRGYKMKSTLKNLIKKLCSRTFAIVFLGIFGAIFIFCLGLSIWRRRQRKQKNIEYTFWGRKKKISKQKGQNVYEAVFAKLTPAAKGRGKIRKKEGKEKRVTSEPVQVKKKSKRTQTHLGLIALFLFIGILGISRFLSAKFAKYILAVFILFLIITIALWIWRRRIDR